ncbi:Smr/MutS family protein [Paraferrimonas sp. SM1919]|uniref:Smr/MutS family protein n=1 Tax=Paraferrimonas sp. SM1919 TaxID=2662263 RepID=UPI0013D7AA83|nr:Smr/MutS family protein [Paraferrimonas sp. SM1919]
MKDEGLDLFFQEMADVKPLQKSNTVVLVKDSTVAKQQKLSAHMFAERINQLMIDKSRIEMLSVDEPIAGKTSGLQTGVYKNLRLAKYDIEAQLDLTGLSLKAARFDFVTFIDDCYRANIRCLLIKHGNGKKNGMPLLKSALKQWLEVYPYIQAYHSAPLKFGGYGATLVLISKNERQKLENREIHKRG